MKAPELPMGPLVQHLLAMEAVVAELARYYPDMSSASLVEAHHHHALAIATATADLGQQLDPGAPLDGEGQPW